MYLKLVALAIDELCNEKSFYKRSLLRKMICRFGRKLRDQRFSPDCIYDLKLSTWMFRKLFQKNVLNFGVNWRCTQKKTWSYNDTRIDSIGYCASFFTCLPKDLTVIHYFIRMESSFYQNTIFRIVIKLVLEQNKEVLILLFKKTVICCSGSIKSENKSPGEKWVTGWSFFIVV